LEIVMIIEPQQFESLESCISTLEEQFSGEIEVLSRDRATGQDGGTVRVPRFLFRGERGFFPTTHCGVDRVLTDIDLLELERKLVLEITEVLEFELRTFLGMGFRDSAGFAQHYGLPTGLLDLTLDLKVAAFFAGGGKPGAIGHVAVFPVQQLLASAALIDLRNNPYASRPDRQSAFALFINDAIDYKADSTIKRLGIRWFRFNHAATDEVLHNDRKVMGLLDCHTDPAAGVLQLQVDGYVEKHGKLPDKIALWLSKRIAPAPFICKVLTINAHGHPDEVELVSVESIGLPYNEDVEYERNYRYWSDKFGLAMRERG
jgi:hypothetical protein